MPNDQDFTCQHCHKQISFNSHMGTRHRNHCTYCLWSKHVDQTVSGDRKATCHALMEPIGLTFKLEGKDTKGELMLIHKCTECNKISINRTAGDDDTDQIFKVFEASKKLDQSLMDSLEEKDIYLAGEKEREEIEIQLFGKKV